MSDQFYNPFIKQATDMQFRFKDLVGEHNHPQAQLLEREIHNLTENAKMRRDPRMLENQVRGIQNHLRLIEHQPDHPLTIDHANTLHHNYEMMRRDLRKFNNY